MLISMLLRTSQSVFVFEASTYHSQMVSLEDSVVITTVYQHATTCESKQKPVSHVSHGDPILRSQLATCEHKMRITDRMYFSKYHTIAYLSERNTAPLK